MGSAPHAVGGVRAGARAHLLVCKLGKEGLLTLEVVFGSRLLLLGRPDLRERMRTHYAESDNELHHLLIMESLGGNDLAMDRTIAQTLASEQSAACETHPLGRATTAVVRLQSGAICCGF